MKGLVTLILVFLIVGCSSSRVEPEQKGFIYSVRTNVPPFNEEGKLQAAISADNPLKWFSPYIDVTFSFKDGDSFPLKVEVNNRTEEPVLVVWYKSSIVTVNGYSHPIINEGELLISPIAAKSKVANTVSPKWMRGYSSVHTIMMCFQIDGKEVYYDFIFQSN